MERFYLIVNFKGPDYDSGNEAERCTEAARLSALLKDWETASAGSRSLPPTPLRKPKPEQKTRQPPENTREHQRNDIPR